MDSLLALPGSILWSILAFLVVISIIVFIHELGHYLVGRWSGIQVDAFSFGFGPELIGFTDGHGTRWKISAIPLGGYVKFHGDADAASTPDSDGWQAMPESERKKTLQGASLPRRAATVAAGPIANFILAIVIFTALFMINGKMIADPVVAEVKPGSAAEMAGIVPGDRLVAIDGTLTETFDDVRRYISMRPGLEVTVTIDRAGQSLDLKMTPKLEEITDPFGNKVKVGLIGIVTSEEASQFRRKTFTFSGALNEAVSESWNVVTSTYDYVAGMISGRMGPEQLGGPIRVAKTSGEVATFGFSALMHLAAVLSVSIGLLNLLPVPLLDGGHLMFYAVEAILGRPLGERAMNIAFRIGMALVLSLMVFATWNDITQILG